MHCRTLRRDYGTRTDGKNQLLPRKTFVIFAVAAQSGAWEHVRSLPLKMPRSRDPVPECATLAQRMVAYLLDGFIMVALLVAATLIAANLSLVSEWLAEGVRVLGALLAAGYRLAADGLMGGASVGKRRAGIWVAEVSTSAPCSLWRSVVRSVPLFLPFINVLDVVWLLVNRRARLGDEIARTLVIQGVPPRPKSRRKRPVAKTKSHAS